MQKRILCYAIACLFSLDVLSQYIYEANQSLYDLQTNSSGSTGLGSNDDAVSSAFNIGFTFDFYGESFTQARMATNGCLHFKISGAYCNDFTPDPLSGQHTYTLYPFWTDLIKDNGSGMRARAFADYTIFGWYKMREYNEANTDNSFEVWLYPNDTFEFRYGGLDIDRHDVLIGEIGSGSKQIYQYYYHDECNTGSTNSSSCVNTDWNNSDKNTNLENGGSLFGSGTGNAIDCTDPLNNAGCSGYADAYQTQQCNITQLYNESCPLYWEAYDDQQCDQDPQYAPFCRGYNQQDSVAYFDEETDYGFSEEDMWYDEEFDEWLDPNDPCYQNNCSEFTDADWYALDVDQFGQEQVDDWLGNDISFSDDGMIDFNTSAVTSYDDLDVQMDAWDLHQDQQHQDQMLLDEFLFQETFMVEDFSEPETFIEFTNVEELEEWFEEETRDREEEFAELEEPEEEFIEEVFEEEVVEEVFEQIEERLVEAEIEEERIEREEVAEESLDIIEEEFAAVESDTPTGKNRLMTVALNVVRAGVQTASNSYSQASGGSQSSSATTNISSNKSSQNSSGGISTSSSPSSSDQYASASAQTNQVLSMSSTAGIETSSTTNTMSNDNVSVGGSTVVQNVAVVSVEAEINIASSDMNTTSEADQIADKIIAANIEAQQEEQEQQQEETGKYGDESKLIALIGYVPAFNNYEKIVMSDATDWYSSQSIYSSATLNDNTSAFYGLVNDNLKGLSQMINDQPNIWR
mgnify:CR=1 FL=1